MLNAPALPPPRGGARNRTLDDSASPGISFLVRGLMPVQAWKSRGRRVRPLLCLALACVLAQAGASFAAEASPPELPSAITTPANWLGLQQARLGDHGLNLSFSYYGTFLANPVGGESRYAAYTHLLFFGGELSLDKTIGWKGASLTVSMADGAGHNLSEEIGNFFTVSDAYVTNTCLFYNLFLKQKLFDDRLELRVGRMAAGDLFAVLPAFGLLVNGGINDNPSSLFVNSPFTAAPDTTWAAYAKYQPASTTYLSSGIFQASPRLGVPAYHGLDFSIRPGDGILLMAEMGWTPSFGAGESKADEGKKSPAPGDSGLPGTYAFGGYYAHYTFDNFLGGTEDNAFGFYGMAQQMVWRSRTNGNINASLWGALVYSPQDQFALMPLYAAAGAIWQGVIPGRDQDQLLFGWQIGKFSADYAQSVVNAGGSRPAYETVFEWSYLVQLNQHVTVQPDLQYVVRPDGFGDIANALVLGLQWTVSF